MSADHKELLYEVACEVLEGLAFVFADRIDNPRQSVASGNAVEVSMCFKGDFEGRLRMMVSSDFSHLIATNVLGLDEDEPIDETAAEDALKEFLNVTCGHVLTSLAGETPVFDLTVPVLAPVSPDDWNTLSAMPDTVALMAEEFALLLHLAVKE